jgi:hypothetical protein
MEVFLQLRLQELLDHRLSNAVSHRRYPQRSRPAIGLGYLDPPHSSRHVAARGQPIPQLIEVVRQVLFELLDRLTVDACRALIDLHSLIGFPHLTFGNGKRLCRIPRDPPVSGCRAVLGWIGQPLRSSPITGLRRYHGLLRLCAPPRYSHTHGITTCVSPFASGRQVPTFRTRACIEVTPPPCRMPPGPSTGTPRACPAVTIPPRFRHHPYAFDTSLAVHLRSSLRLSPDRVSPDLFPTRSPPRLLSAAAVGGLEPAPARRLRGTCPHLSCSMAARKNSSFLAPSWHTIVGISDSDRLSL